MAVQALGGLLWTYRVWGLGLSGGYISGPFRAVSFRGCRYIGWILPRLSNSWIILIVWLYIALNRTPNIDCYWVGTVPNI